jgi:hypothetical protein
MDDPTSTLIAHEPLEILGFEIRCDARATFPPLARTLLTSEVRGVEVAHGRVI